MSNLLLVACSKRKLHTAGLLPAGNRYDGGAFRVVKRARREGYAPRNLTILILSAKYGLIPENFMIEDYDQIMDSERANALREEVGYQLDDVVGQLRPQSIFVSLGLLYSSAIAPAIVFGQLEQAGIVERATGRPGERQAQLRAWLWKRACAQVELASCCREMGR
jgi:hypothetical protein